MGRVDWNIILATCSKLKPVASRMGRVDWNFYVQLQL